MGLKPVLEIPAALNPASLVTFSAAAVEALAELRRKLDDLHDQLIRECNFRPDSQCLRELKDRVQHYALRMPCNVELSLIHDTIAQAANPLHLFTKGPDRV